MTARIGIDRRWLSKTTIKRRERRRGWKRLSRLALHPPSGLAIGVLSAPAWKAWAEFSPSCLRLDRRIACGSGRAKPRELWWGLGKSKGQLRDTPRASMRRAFLEARSGGYGRWVSRRWGSGVLALAKVLEDSPDEARLGDEGHEPELASATVTKQGVDLKDPPNEVGPSTSERCLAGRAENGIGRDRRSELIRSRPLALKTASAAEVGVSTVVKVM